MVNIDLPWNPAKLEQRIARAWRKGQMRGVTVVNLVCEDSIEHGMVHLLGAKQALSDGVLDGQGDLAALKMPSGRGAMIERMQELMQASAPVAGKISAPRVAPPEETIAEDLTRRHGARALLIESHQGADRLVRLLAVLDLDHEALQAETKRLSQGDGSALRVDVIDRATWSALAKLQASGLLQFAAGVTRQLHLAAELADTELETAAKAAQARIVALRGQAERALTMARVLCQGGFPEEAPPLLATALSHIGAALLAAEGELPAAVTKATPVEFRALAGRKGLSGQAIATLDTLLAAGASSDTEVRTDRILTESRSVGVRPCDSG